MSTHLVAHLLFIRADAGYLQAAPLAYSMILNKEMDCPCDALRTKCSMSYVHNNLSSSTMPFGIGCTNTLVS
jgi:hypothetical protein